MQIRIGEWAAIYAMYFIDMAMRAGLIVWGLLFAATVVYFIGATGMEFINDCLN